MSSAFMIISSVPNIACIHQTILIVIHKIWETIQFFLLVLLVMQLFSCGTTRWYSVEEQLAESVAYISDGVYVSGDYIRSATVTEIDGNEIKEGAGNKLTINTGTHHVKIYCDEAKGSFNSNDLKGRAKTLEFEAQTQRKYKAYCMPYTHWWIEDLDNGKTVAGYKPEQIQEIN